MPTSTNTGNRMKEHATIDDVREDLAALKSDLTDLAKGLRSSGMDAAKDRVDALSEKAHEVAERSRETAHRKHDELSDFVSERPITSLAIAVGVGALAGRLLSQRK